MFFDSSAPLQAEADTWFLREIGGKADTVLKYVARNAGMMHKELVNAIRDASGEDVRNTGSYLTTLTERYRLIERKLPVFAKEDARKGRYYVTDNFLAARLTEREQPHEPRGDHGTSHGLPSWNQDHDKAWGSDGAIAWPVRRPTP